MDLKLLLICLVCLPSVAPRLSKLTELSDVFLQRSALKKKKINLQASLLPPLKMLLATPYLKSIPKDVKNHPN